MGWTERYTSEEMTWREAIDFMDEIYTWSNEYGQTRPVRSWLVPDPEGHDHQGRRYIYYSAVERVSDSERTVWAGIALVTLRRNSILFKDMSEDLLPTHHRCPTTLLTLLTPTDDALANEWRARAASQTR